MFDGKAFGQEVVTAVKLHLDKSIAPLLSRMDAVERQIAGMASTDAIETLKQEIGGIRAAAQQVKEGPAGKDGRDGIDGKDGAPGLNGKDADPVMVASLVVSEVKAAVAAIPAAKDGVDGRAGLDGKDGAPGRDGVDGKDGAPGLNGKDGMDGMSITVDDVREVITEEVQKAVASLPKPERGEKGEPGKDGRDGVDGKDGVNGIDGKDGAAGLNGKDGRDGVDGAPGKEGVGAAGALIDRSGNLVLTLTDGTQRELGVVVGKDGVDGRDGIDGQAGKNGVDGANGEKGIDGKDGLNGKDGADGVGFDDIEELIEDDGRFIVRRFTRNGIAVAEKRHQTKMPIWRGVFDAKRKYLPGDMATWKGSLWHCNAEIEGKIGSEHWSLAVKKGRDAPEPNS